VLLSKYNVLKIERTFMKIKLNSAGIAHLLVPVAFIVIFAICGVAYLVATSANECGTPASGAVSGAVSTSCPASGAVSIPQTQATEKTVQAESLQYINPKYIGSVPPFIALWSNMSGSGTVTLPNGASSVAVTARGTQCKGAPIMALSVDGKLIKQYNVSTATTTYRTNLTLTKGDHAVKVAFINDYRASGSCDRNLYIDKVTFRS
jgi:Ca-dependent carbohydrate-binding module xylan-binding